MTAIVTVRQKPVEVQAIQWTGDNADEVFEFTGCSHFDVLEESDRANSDDPDCSAAVFNKIHSTWIPLKDGQWIIRGVKGEFTRCADDVFRETYEPTANRPDLDGLYEWIELRGERDKARGELAKLRNDLDDATRVMLDLGTDRMADAARAIRKRAGL
jgi:hypothetical protein